MIEVSLTDLMLVSVTAAVTLLGIFWLVAVAKERRQENQARQDLVSCRICGNIYENQAKSKVTACPRCGSLNEAMKPKPI